MGSASDFAKKAALTTTKETGKLLWASTKRIGKFAWGVTKALHPFVTGALITYGLMMCVLIPPLGVTMVTMGVASFLTPFIAKRAGSIAANLFPKATKTVNRLLKREQEIGYTKAPKPENLQRPLKEQDPNGAFNKSHSGHFNDRSSYRRWEKSFDNQDKGLDRQGLELHEQINKASHERLGTMNPFNSGGRL